MQRDSIGSRLYDLGLANSLRTLLVACALVGSTVGLAQIDYRPTPPPPVGAANRSWYRSGEPIPFAGDLYYPTGPAIYFNGDSMVPTGDYDGVTLYADTTAAPYSVLLVPVSDRLLQPYVPKPSSETASAMRLPYYRQDWPDATAPSSSERQSFGAQQQREPRQPGWRDRPLPPEYESGPYHMETVRKPEGNAGIWLSFEGHRWHQVGEAVPLDHARLAPIGEYSRFPVYADSHEPYVIYIPTRANLVAPFRRAQR
ncbi:MAG: hypothetical protein ACM3NQ_23515 [Bacteroidales bacterium]